ncbi:GDH/6PGL endoplasmic bifunctional protein-like [Acanthaster planci]|uniref:GDH/6PGL endoplasmic bifunctional protein-like n=1 Tax=Acanthaster planci TaxID=133434 RepID=A0A8B7Z1G2_ACAPL|nr:GDH/6PGL endoplasmic bifunctional protein-like [Acanthaster planci]
MMKAMHMRLLKVATCCLLIGCVVIVVFVHGSEKTHPPVVSVVIVGGTGDLATRYLWQGFFSLYQGQKNDYSFNFYGAARMPASEGDSQVANILQRNVSCAKSVQPGPGCETLLDAYRAKVFYRKLKTAQDYAEFCREMKPEGAKEHGRLFYLSVPPFAYAGIAKNIAQGCRPEGDTWLRVVLEKPFGHDYGSAQELAAQLAEHLREEEIYRIDHYLGKIGVQSILPFRALNDKKYKDLWNREHIERVEVVMKEKIDTKGRLEFYNEYGVIRDVMQNHLTEIFTLVAMEVPTNISSRSKFLGNKIHLLSQTQPVKLEQAVIGQYDGYTDQWRQELGKGASEETLVPTFAAVAFYVENPRWKGVPFVLLAGKKLDERIGYVRVVFKDNAVCVSKAGSSGAANRCAKHQQVVFYTGNPGLKYPTILVSKHLPKPTVPESWSVPDANPNTEIFGSNLSDFHYFSPPKDQDAYTALIASCFHGDQKMFVGTDDLMASWKIWTPLLKSLENQRPRIYSGGEDTGTWLDFRVKGKTVKFLHKLDDPLQYQEPGPAFRSISNRFRSRPLVTGKEESVVAQLAQHLLSIAADSIQKRGSFHVAFPGGSTPKNLFAQLAKSSNHFPWEDTHIWMVDERCVPFTDDYSNFKQLHDSLIQFVSIPYLNINPMPVKLANGFCATTDKGADTYEDDLMHLPDGRLDYILLGVGADGHVASLFPNHPTVGEKSAKVVLSDGGPRNNVPNRMTLTLPTVNRARHVGILILGKGKRDIVSVLKTEGVRDPLRYPVTGVDLDDGEQVWYIDHEALV